MNRFERMIYQGSLSAEDRVEIYDSFREFLLDGLSAESTYQRMITHYSRRGRCPKNPIAQILTECAQNLNAGLSLADSLRAWIPSQELSIIESADSVGQLPEGFLKAIMIAESTQKIRKATRSAVGVACYMLALALGIITAFCMMVVPVIVQTLPLENWSGEERFVYDLYRFLVTYHWMAILSAVGMMAVLWYSLPRWTGKTRAWADKVPPYTIYKRVQGISFILSLNAMLSTDIPLQVALEKLAKSTPSNWMKERLIATLQAIEAGADDVGTALDMTGYEFPSGEAIIKMQSLFKTAHKSGSLDRFTAKFLDKTIVGVERTGQAIKLLSLFFCAGAIIYLLYIMSGLLQRVIHF